ncbi:DUF4912 domain-containing protein [Bacillus spongiae]|uniref:DUF4912 domain-containing protein n=1 Tax=Bacillus spongiae TaxID=2683610 RepID=A0ABU8H966_9BACI
MLEDIIKLREKGLSFRKIAIELNTTVGKVQYRWLKYQKSNEKKAVNKQDNNVAISRKKRKGKVTKIPTLMKKIYPKRQASMALLFSSPTRAYCYWNIDPTILSFKMDKKNPRTLQPILKIYDITSISFNGHNEHQSFTIYLKEGQSDWFISGLKGNRTYCAEYGFLIGDSFFPLIRSNSLHTPRLEDDQFSFNMTDLQQFEKDGLQEPNWVEHVSTYSYYEVKGLKSNE